jgi:predicted transcriptional regulator
MVNTEAFTKRLKIITDYYDISAAILADKMDVPRSSISHILSGRNKPSLDFVLKILNAFPEVDLYWLLNGIGTFPKNEVTTKNINITPIPSENKIEKQIKSDNTVASNTEESIIERIVVFYKDGTFKNYMP